MPYFLKILSLLGLISIFHTVEAQVLTFQKKFGGTSNEYIRKVICTYDSSYVISGITSSFGVSSGSIYLAKFNSSGNPVWDRTYNGGDGALVIQTIDSGFALLGNKSSPAIYKDLCLIRTDKNGMVLWSKIYGSNSNDYYKCIITTKDGGFIIGGSSAGAGLWKLDSNGNLEWSKRYAGTGFLYSAIACTDGGYALTGEISTSPNNRDIFLLRIDDTGMVAWAKKIGSNVNDQAYVVRQTADSGFLVAGSTDGYGYGGLLLKVDAMGDLSWGKVYRRPQARVIFYSMEITKDGHLALVGETSNLGNDVLLAKADTSGTIIWSKAYGTSMVERGKSVVECDDGGFFIAGGTENPFGPEDNWYLIKTDSFGLSGCNEADVFFSDTLVYPAVTDFIPVVSSIGTFSAVTITGNSGAGVVTTLCSSVGIEAINASQEVSIYPNPSTGIFSFSSASQAVTVEIFSALGEKIHETTSPRKITILDLSSQPKGIYFCCLKPGNGQALWRKIIIQ